MYIDVLFRFKILVQIGNLIFGTFYLCLDFLTLAKARRVLMIHIKVVSRTTVVIWMKFNREKTCKIYSPQSVLLHLDLAFREIVPESAK